METGQTYPALIQKTSFRTVLICGIIAVLLAGSIHLSYNPLHCMEFYYRDCELEDHTNYLCFRQGSAYCCQHSQDQDDELPERSREEHRLPRYDQCKTIKDCDLIFMETKDRKCMEEMNGYQGLGLVLYAGALTCLGFMIFLYVRHRREKEQFWQQLRMRQQYPANSLQLQNIENVGRVGGQQP